MFCTTDTHGCLKELKSCFEQANFDYENDQLIHLGDVVDRGTDSFGVVEELLKIKNLIAIRGNHDDWMRSWFESGVHPVPSQFIQTRQSYLKNAEDNILNIPQSHRDFFANQIDYYLDNQNRFFCHAGFNSEYLVEDHLDYMFYWNYDLFKRAMCVRTEENRLNDVNGFKRIFIGHQPTTAWKDGGKSINKPIYAAQVVNLDTGGYWYNGKISLLDITDDDNHILYQS